MRYIEKGNEPNSLIVHRSTPGANFGGCDKGDIQDALLAEQFFVCAYCMQRISKELNTKYEPKIGIEHYKSQKRHTVLTLNYGNMLGVCNGNAGMPKDKLICDKAKAKYDMAGAKGKDLSINPQNSLLVGRIKYTAKGEIFSDDETIGNDLNTMLNLNEQELKEYRAAIYKKVREKTRNILRSGNQVRRQLIQEKAAWTTSSADNKLRPLAAVAVYVIDKRLRRLNS